MACSSPVTVMVNGEPMRFACGKCTSCLNTKSWMYEQQTRVENEKAKYCIFVTLTYAPEHLPSVFVYFDNKPDVSYTSLSFYTNTPRVIRHYNDECLMRLSYPRMSDEDLEKFKLPFTLGKFNLSRLNEMGILFYKDIQLFQKRFRYFHLEKLAKFKYGTTFRKLDNEKKNALSRLVSEKRFFVCGEYGPSTFRPHWHLLYFFDSPELFSGFFSSIRQAWTYGRLDIQLSSGQASSYVSGYLNANSTLPKVLIDTFRPFCRHSSHYGFASIEKGVYTPKETTFETLRGRCLSYGGRVHELSIPASLENYLFPKCYGFGEANDLCKLRRYTCYREFAREFPGFSVDQMISAYFRYDVSDSTYFREFFSPGIMVGDSRHPDACLRATLYRSRHFLRMCERYNMSPEEYIGYIDKYYNDKNTFALLNFYKNFQKNYAEFDPMAQIFEYINFPLPDADAVAAFDERGTSPFSPEVHDRLSLFACQVGCTLSNLFHLLSDLRGSPVLQYKFHRAEELANEKIKHKKQNDLNKLLYG